MHYIALARKWRPQTFTTLLGQDPITRALTQSLTQNRVHHAYLFTGTRGVGKTSVARIMAKALNCEQGVSAHPCLTCDACVAIEEGRFVDLIEIDGASKTRVEDTRELLDNVQYAPTIGRFKIYLIDEVHMLSQHSFNALLKTLEEPPAHVKFLLATTDPQKLPITILSRCLKFHLKEVAETTIHQHLKHILDSEQITYEPQALLYITKAARGSLRDALSILDQVIAGRDGTLLTADVTTLLGCSSEDYARQLLQALIAQQPEALITISHKIAEDGGHFRYVLDELLGYLHRMAIGHALPNTPVLIEPDPSIATFCQQLSAEDTQLFYQIALKGTQDLSYAPTLAMGFEMTLLRMYTFKPANTVLLPPLAYQADAPIAAIAAPLLSPKPSSEQPWNAITTQLKLTGLALTAIQHTELLEKTLGSVVLKVEKAHQSIFTEAVIARISDGLSAYYGMPTRLSFQYFDQPLDSPAAQKKELKRQRTQEQTEALQTDPVFQQIQKEFSADVVMGSIEEKA